MADKTDLVVVVVVYRGQRYALTASGVRRLVTVDDYRPQRRRT